MRDNLRENWEYNEWPDVDLDGNIINPKKRLHEEAGRACPKCGKRVCECGKAAVNEGADKCVYLIKNRSNGKYMDDSGAVMSSDSRKAKVFASREEAEKELNPDGKFKNWENTFEIEELCEGVDDLDDFIVGPQSDELANRGGVDTELELYNDSWRQVEGKKIRLTRDVYYSDLDSFYYDDEHDENYVPPYAELRGEDVYFPAGTVFTVIEAFGPGGGAAVLAPEVDKDVEYDFGGSEPVYAEIVEDDMSDDEFVEALADAMIENRKCNECGGNKLITEEDEESEEENAEDAENVEEVDLNSQVAAALDTCIPEDDEDFDITKLIDAVLAYFSAEDNIAYILSVLAPESDADETEEEDEEDK